MGEPIRSVKRMEETTINMQLGQLRWASLSLIEVNQLSGQPEKIYVMLQSCRLTPRGLVLAYFWSTHRPVRILCYHPLKSQSLFKTILVFSRKKSNFSNTFAVRKGVSRRLVFILLMFLAFLIVLQLLGCHFCYKKDGTFFRLDEPANKRSR